MLYWCAMNDRADEVIGESSRHGPDAGRVKALGEAVRRRRHELGLRQAELAELAGCSQRFVHTVEHGKLSLQLDKVLDLLDVLGLALLVVPGRGRVADASERPRARGESE